MPVTGDVSGAYGKAPEVDPTYIPYDQFMHNQSKLSDREILERIHWESYVARLQVQANGHAIIELRERVDDIEKQANDAMANLTTPEAMMDMADKFLGGGKK